MSVLTIRGRYVRGAPYVGAIFSNPRFRGGFLRFLIDTGAASTVLQARELRRLGISPADLRPSSTRLAGIAGVTPCYQLRDVDLTFRTTAGGTYIRQVDVLVLPAPAAIPGLPSVMGRDLLNSFALHCDYRTRIVSLTL